MKATRILTIVLVSLSIGFVGCTEEDPVLTKAEKNENILRDILRDNTIRWVHIYEYSTVTGEWELAADNQTYTEGMELCRIEDSYFYLSGAGSKSYANDVPTHQLSGFYYFNLEYLVSFELGANEDELYLYFKY